MSNIIIPTEFASPGIARPIDDSCVLQTISRGSRQKGTKVFDLSKKGNHGTIYGAVWKTLPSGLNVLKFDGVDDYADCGNDDSLDVGSNSFSLCYYMKPSVLDGTVKMVISKGKDKRYRSGIFSSNRLYFEVDDDVDATHIETISLTANVWYFVVAVRTETKLKLYLNGELVKEKKLYSTGDMDDQTTDLFIGQDARMSNQFFSGIITGVRIYNRALSASEIREHFENERILFGV